MPPRPLAGLAGAVRHRTAAARFASPPRLLYNPTAAVNEVGGMRMGEREVRVLEREAVFKGYFRVDRYRLRHSLHAGGMGPELLREVFERGHVAAVLPVDPLRERVILIEQFRPGAHAAGWEPWLLECVAGVLEPGETPEQLCEREAVEEAGLRITALEPIARFLTSPGACSETVALYSGRVDASGAGGLHGLAHEGEDIRVHDFSVAEAISLLDEGRIVNAKTVIALQWLALHWDTLRRQWC